MTRSPHSPERGWDWPPALDTWSRPEISSDERDRQRIRAILSVTPGERPLFPELGWEARRVLDTLDSPAARAIAGTLAEEALGRWAPDLEVIRVDVVEASRSGLEPGEVELLVTRRFPGAPLEVRLPGLGAGASRSERRDGDV